eukprot:175404_1
MQADMIVKFNILQEEIENMNQRINDISTPNSDDVEKNQEIFKSKMAKMQADMTAKFGILQEENQEIFTNKIAKMQADMIVKFNILQEEIENMNQRINDISTPNSDDVE